MTIEGLALALQEKGIQVFVRREARVPLRVALKEPVAPLQEVRLGVLGVPEAGLLEETMVKTTPMRIRGLPPDTRVRPGLIVAPSVYEAAAFLYDRFEPRGSHDVDSLVRDARARKGSKYARVEWLAERLSHQDSEDDDEMPFVVRRQADRRLGGFLWKWEDFRRRFRSLSRSNPRVMLPVWETRFRHHDGPAFCVVVEKTRTIRGHRVPRWDLLMAQQTRDSHLVIRGCHEGRWFDIPFSQADPRMTEAFDDGGRLLRMTEGDLLFGEFLAPRFVVRVPRGKPTRASGAEAALPQVARGLWAAYLLDSRYPQDLPDDLPVVEDPVEAWAILLRTTGGVFLPDAAATDPPEAIRRLSGTYLVASVPPLGGGVP